MPTPAAKRATACEAEHPSNPKSLGPDLEAWLHHLVVERRLAARTVAMYRDALGWLKDAAAAHPVALRAVQPHHVRRFAATLRERGLGPRSIAIALAAWRGLYRWWGRQGEVSANPVDGIRAPKAPKPLPKARVVIQFQVTPREKRHIQRKARRAGLSVSQLLRSAARTA